MPRLRSTDLPPESSIKVDDTTIVLLRDVDLSYEPGAKALAGVDLKIQSGSFHFLTGESGAGKTSLLRLLSLSVHPERGQMNLFGRDVARLHRRERASLRQRIGVIFQDFRLLKHLTAFDNVALPLRIAGMKEDRIASTVCDMFTWLELEEIMEKRPAELSIGQQQLVAIARGVITRPKLLLADEPTSNVDQRRADRLINLFLQMEKLGTSVIFATHSGDLLRRHRFPALHMEKGRLRTQPRAGLQAAG
ncbi:MAG: ATP-binding cassette domain-containing protein [Geminicoccaceae bacterium]|nr:ATP-binding cassette domain-containing protein [Geminicoccaceae bacterium]